MEIFNHRLRLHADPSRVVVRPFHLGWQSNGSGISRSQRLIGVVLEMTEDEASEQLEAVLKDFEARHWQTRRVFMARYDQIAAQHELDSANIGDVKRQLIGAYFCLEYSYAAAALMNPSVVPHHDQSGMPKGSQRFVMSLRAVGEGHISSIAFREGIITARRELKLAPEPPFATAADAKNMDEEHPPTGAVRVHRHRDSTLSGTVIFPITDEQRFAYPVRIDADQGFPCVRPRADDRHCGAQQGDRAIPAQGRRHLYGDRSAGRGKPLSAQDRRSDALGRRGSDP